MMILLFSEEGTSSLVVWTSKIPHTDGTSEINKVSCPTLLCKYSHHFVDLDRRCCMKYLRNVSITTSWVPTQGQGCCCWLSCSYACGSRANSTPFLWLPSSCPLSSWCFASALRPAALPCLGAGGVQMGIQGAKLFSEQPRNDVMVWGHDVGIIFFICGYKKLKRFIPRAVCCICSSLAPWHFSGNVYVMHFFY